MTVKICIKYVIKHLFVCIDLLSFLPVIIQVKRAVKKLGAKYVFVATDDRDMIPQFQKEIKKV